jgi:hypothetical protein
VSAAVGEALKQGTPSVIGGLSNWLFSSLGDLTGDVFGFIDRSTSPNVLAAWFVDGSTGAGPYKQMATVAATLMCVLVFGAVIQGVAQADLGGMARRMVVNVPAAVIGITGTVVVVQVLVELTDDLAKYLTSSVGGDTQSLVSTVQSMASTSNNGGAAVVVLGILLLAAALVVFVELLIRSLLIYLIVALCPLAWAALVWPALQAALRKTLELLVAVILSKVVVALALAVGAAAISGIGAAQVSPSLAGFEFAPPAASAQTAGQPDLSQGAGLLAVGVATFALAAFSPFLIARLLPFAEAAVVAQGTRGAPVRAGTQVSQLRYRLDVVRRFGARAGPTSSGGVEGVRRGGSMAATASAPSASGAAGRTAAGGGAALGAVAVPVAAVGAVAKATNGARRHAERSADGLTSEATPSSSGRAMGGSTSEGRGPSTLRSLGERPQSKGPKS